MSSRLCRTLCAALALVACAEAQAQFVSGFEAPVYAGSAAGTIITGQDMFYNPVAGSQDGLVMTYAGNSLGLPANPTGGDQFVASIGADPLPAVPVPFSRAQRDIVYGSGTGVWTAAFDIAAATALVTTLPASDNIGSFSTQLFPGEQTLIALARWTDPLTAANWNADYVWFDAIGTQLIEQVPDPGFQNLQIDHWYHWSSTFDLTTNQVLSVSITDLTTAVTATHNPVGRFLFGGAAGAPTPTGFRFFGGTNAGSPNRNALAFDNLSIIPEPGVVSLLVLGGSAMLLRRRRTR